MIALEIVVNGKRLTVAGADDLCVLNSIVNAVGKLGSTSRGTKRENEKPDLFLTVGGLTSRPVGRKDEHLTWVSHRPLKVGDEVQIRLVETRRPRSPVKARSAGGNVKKMNEKKMFEMAKAEYMRLRSKYEDTER